MDARRAQGSKSIVFDTRPGSPSYHAWWRGDGDQVSVFLHGYDSIWLPEALLGVDKRAGLAEALFRASRHMTVSLHFNKGLAGSTPEAIRSARETATRSAPLRWRSRRPAARQPTLHCLESRSRRSSRASMPARWTRRRPNCVGSHPTPALMCPKATISTPTGRKPSGAPITPVCVGSRRLMIRSDCSPFTTASAARSGALMGSPRLNRRRSSWRLAGDLTHAVV